MLSVRTVQGPVLAPEELGGEHERRYDPGPDGGRWRGVISVQEPLGFHSDGGGSGHGHGFPPATTRSVHARWSRHAARFMASKGSPGEKVATSERSGRLSDRTMGSRGRGPLA